MRGISVILTTVVAIVFILGACAKPVAAPPSEPPSTPEPIPAPTPSPTPVPETPAQEPTPAPTPPVEKEIEVHYRTFWVYFPREDSFTNREVTGVTESWAMDVHNVGERLVANATLSLDTNIVFDQLIPHPATLGPPTYRWSFGDIMEGAGSSAVVGLRPSPDVSLPVTFSPGFDASRFADKNMFSEPGIQTIALEVIGESLSLRLLDL
jgi:hypothetical protein